MRGMTGAATVAMLLLAVPLQGQGGPRGGQGQQGMRGQRSQGAQMQRGGGMQMGSAYGILWLREELELTEDQIERLKSTSEAERTLHDGARLQMRGMRDQLRDGDITRGQFMDLMTAHREAMQSGRSELKAQADAILTDTQKERLETLRDSRSEGQRGMKGRRGAGKRRSG